MLLDSLVVLCYFQHNCLYFTRVGLLQESQSENSSENIFMAVGDRQKQFVQNQVHGKS